MVRNLLMIKSLNHQFKCYEQKITLLSPSFLNHTYYDIGMQKKRPTVAVKSF